MSHPTFWPRKTFFYPIGNTPPICLTDHLPPEDDATILLLGCGDPRSILYTVAADHGTRDRPMDITCCDWEPAIIARNVLLLSLLLDNVGADRLLLYWSIFYDLFIDKNTASILNEQCIKLVESAADIAAWHASPYGSFFKFTTRETLNEARRHWSSYTETLALSNAEQRQLKTTFLSDMRKESRNFTGSSLSAVPSAAPLSHEFLLLSTETYNQYWKTGVADADAASPLTVTQVNPTFLFSVAGRQFNMHYGTDPCAAFHLALALTEATYDDGFASTPAKTVREVWSACRDQFSRWAVAFHRRLNGPHDKTPTIVVRFACGDALAFCDGLRLCKTGDYTPTIYSSMWGGAKFSFHDQTMPTSFNVIDTSNLSDHLGLLNVLVAVVPLFHRTPAAVLNTSSLLSYKDHPTQRSAVEERALLDFPSLSLFLGISPVCFSSGLAFRNCSEAASMSAILGRTERTRHYERVSWKFTEYAHAKWSGAPTQRNHEIRFKPDDLANKLFDVYLRMFEDENLGSAFGRLQTGNFSKLQIQNTHYHRQSFVRFLQVIRSLGFVETIWPQTLSHFIDRVTTDTQLLVGPNNAQNLFAELHMWGVHSEAPFLPDFVSKMYGKSPAPYQSWSLVPPVICIVLKVPRAALKVLEDIPVDEIGHPLLACETFHTMHNTHDSIRPIFGDIVDREGRKVITEDPEGLRGNSALIVSFFVSSWILADQSRNLKVGLCIKNSPRHPSNSRQNSAQH
ncbi:hypothetical protein D9756_000165 [Leucocoprinus leucothites]|uniref:DUF4470 domain-containing protein n=1 Tax=Leucocoprinus leucothites TaxID=201217 RepID=A0A8H5GFK1_9AGAR|nr:hypothetical protein D9756_000165 [Leucoagaricus leucothites]